MVSHESSRASVCTREEQLTYDQTNAVAKGADQGSQEGPVLGAKHLDDLGPDVCAEADKTGC